ncbi:Alpha/Beta hydrolase protein [Gongronella butleri]|nr:Alpha/Beta hydrolase protein [Gongronella butleri]
MALSCNSHDGHHVRFNEIRDRGQRSLGRKGRHRQSLYGQYVQGMLTSLLLTSYFNWTMIFYDPFSAIATLAVYPTIMIALLFVEVILKILLEYLGGARLLKSWSRKYGHGLSMVNWGSPSWLLSGDAARKIKASLPLLGMPASTQESDEQEEGPCYRVFDITIAQTMTQLAALVYERDGELVKRAYDLYMARSQQNGDVDAATETEMENLIKKSEATIRAIARRWGLRFEGVTELKSLGGTFCGIFWSEVHPFIVVCCKGTTPTNYEEFLVDCTIQRSDARPYLFGAAHQGFYDSIYPTKDAPYDDRDPYQAILNAIHAKAKAYHAGVNVQVWVTGHSLGGALSTMLFARWLKSPNDFRAGLTLRDCYALGSPAVGDATFASEFASHSHLSITRKSSMWRVINQYDIVSRIPVGLDNRVAQFASQWDFFNYVHVGNAIYIPPHINNRHTRDSQGPLVVKGARVRIIASNIKKGGDVLYTKKNGGHDDDNGERTAVPSDSEPNNGDAKRDANRAMFNPIHLLESLYPRGIGCHIPNRYDVNLEKVRAFYPPN